MSNLTICTFIHHQSFRATKDLTSYLIKKVIYVIVSLEKLIKSLSFFYAIRAIFDGNNSIHDE